MIDHQRYLAFLPPAWRKTAPEPQSRWWQWSAGRLHIACVPQPQAAARLLILHGAGGHSAALWPFAALAAQLGYEVLLPDLPGYGLSEMTDPAALRYEHWLDCLREFIAQERQRDARPLLLLGASIGGMLAYSLVAQCPGIARLIVTCLLDPRLPQVREGLARWPWLGRISPALLRMLAPLSDRLRLPIRWLTPMSRIANDARLARLCRHDPRGGGSRIALGFLRSYLQSVPACEPEDFREVPVVLAHPAADRWTAPGLSLTFFERIAAPKRLLMLEKAGHFPVEAPALTQLQALLRETLAEFGGG
ncbi:Lysophospholipase, alpha-beta hydrolase superfamily [Solimonas aquatica]|uniref:Lysophospholipase, alpha-beta hydrolase superfamily n=1 Tax=Solimonas aquatica TaxID=489703 RepID=A0A1H9M1I6_9GAMM|nr:alpha/beta hydrolase [Solimonas aquatica]SER17335.1 Lysophospholipase, alpha-beta hydrolase superfamily [Solimonas aquatica]